MSRAPGHGPPLPGPCHCQSNVHGPALGGRAARHGLPRARPPCHRPWHGPPGCRASATLRHSPLHVASAPPRPPGGRGVPARPVAWGDPRLAWRMWLGGPASLPSPTGGLPLPHQRPSRLSSLRPSLKTIRGTLTWGFVVSIAKIRREITCAIFQVPALVTRRLDRTIPNLLPLRRHFELSWGPRRGSFRTG
jgi:hypothetical protein